MWSDGLKTRQWYPNSWTFANWNRGVVRGTEKRSSQFYDFYWKVYFTLLCYSSTSSFLPFFMIVVLQLILDFSLFVFLGWEEIFNWWHLCTFKYKLLKKMYLNKSFTVEWGSPIFFAYWCHLKTTRRTLQKGLNCY